MELKTKQQWRFHILCGLLVLVACCFRTGAILWEREKEPAPKEDLPFYYMPPSQGEKESMQWWERPQLDPSMVEIDNRCGADFDKEALLKKGIPLKGGQNPCVLILHSHGSEAYSDQPGYRSGDTDKNIVRVGQEIAQRLNALGISTIHDTTMHDVTKGYNDSYGQAGAAIARYLEEYPTIQVVVDVHRDAVADLQGRQKAVVTEDGSGARMLFVMGTDKGDLPHENWQDNLAFAMQLHGIMEAQNPGLMRPISLRAARYNEHFTPCSILLEVGSAGNTMEQALYSAELFANGLGDLIHSLTEESGG